MATGREPSSWVSKPETGAQVGLPSGLLPGSMLPGGIVPGGMEAGGMGAGAGAGGFGLCGACNRVRLTSEGLLKPCLQYGGGTDLRQLLIPAYIK